MSNQELNGAAIFSTAVRLMRGNMLLLAGLPFVVNLGLAGISAVLTALLGTSQLWLELMFPPLISGLVVLVAADILAGQRIDLGAHWGRIMQRFLPLVLLSLVATVVSGLGLLALIIPGLYVGAVMLPLVSVMLFEDAGWSGLARTYDMTQPVAWPLVGLILRLTLLASFTLLPMVLVTVWLIEADANVPMLLLNGLGIFVGSTFAAIASVCGLIVYQDLRGSDVSQVFR